MVRWFCKMSDLFLLLDELNAELIKSEQKVRLTIIGGFALHLHGLSIRPTMDVDTITDLDDLNIDECVKRIGKKYGIKSWLNDQSYNLIMPDDYEKRLIKKNNFSNIELYVVSKEDLIKLKVAAYYYRRDFENRDLEDLILLKPTDSETRDAISFLKTKHLPEDQSYRSNFLEEVDELYDILKQYLYN